MAIHCISLLLKYVIDFRFKKNIVDTHVHFTILLCMCVQDDSQAPHLLWLVLDIKCYKCRYSVCAYLTGIFLGGQRGNFAPPETRFALLNDNMMIVNLLSQQLSQLKFCSPPTYFLDHTYTSHHKSYNILLMWFKDLTIIIQTDILYIMEQKSSKLWFDHHTGPVWSVSV